jgi:hypothetical protein
MGVHGGLKGRQETAAQTPSAQAPAAAPGHCPRAAP